MKKNSKFLKNISFILLIAVVGIVFTSGTYAKYTTALGGSDTATVAKFDVTAGSLNKEKSATIALFDTIKEADTTSTEEHVGGTKKIAPGTGGSFDVVLTNNSEVAVEAVITLSEVNESSIPIEYSVDNSNWQAADLTTKTVNLALPTGVATTDTVKVQWRWAFTGNDDAADTALGEAGTATVKTTVTATFTQVD